MNVTLIAPAMIKTATSGERHTFAMPPLTLAALAGLTPPDVDVQMIDDRFQAINYDEPRDLVGLTVKTFTARRAYEIAAEFRKRGVPVIMGGFHPSLLPDESIQHADSVFIGEAEELWQTVLDDARRGQLQRFYHPAHRPENFNRHINRSVCKDIEYLPVALVETSRGCLHDCSFCSIHSFFGRDHRSRPPEDVVAEVAAIDRKLVVFFIDDNIVAHPQTAKALFSALIPLKRRWVGQGSLTMVRDRELMRLMRDSGCAGLLVGIESLNQGNLSQMNKSWNTVGLGMEEALKIPRDYGIAVVGSFVLGMDVPTAKRSDAGLGTPVVVYCGQTISRG